MGNKKQSDGSIKVNIQANDISGSVAIGNHISQSQDAVQYGATPPLAKRRRPSRTFPPKELREILTDYFDDGELRELCFDLEVDYESLPGSGKGVKALELVAYSLRHNQYEDLVDYCRKARPSTFT